MEDTIMKNNLDILESSRFKTVRLSNQLIVGNFSSPHPFTFDDGSVLDAVNDYDSERLKVIFNETVVQVIVGDKHHKTVSLDFSLTVDVLEEMEIWEKMWKHNDVDVVLCPLVMIQALKSISNVDLVADKTPFRAVRLKDRIKKLASIDTFSI
jgi:hypothetical protein